MSLILIEKKNILLSEQNLEKMFLKCFKNVEFKQIIQLFLFSDIPRGLDSSLCSTHDHRIQGTVIKINVINSVITLVPILCIRINNILTLYNILIMFIMTRPLYSGQVISTCCLIN